MFLPDVLELLKQLEAEHDSDRHLYRGQMKRYERYRWTGESDSGEVEALFPADFRFAYEFTDFSSPDKAEMHARRTAEARDHGRNVRDAFSTFLLGRFANLASDADPWRLAVRNEFEKDMLSVRSGQTQAANTAFSRMAWSLAQHYLVATALTDVTFDLRIAAWFATQPWCVDQEGPKDGQRGVIYRIDRNLLNPILIRGTELFRQFNASQGAPPAPDLFLEDIRDIPPSFAARPSAQQGASIHGFDKSIVLGAAFKGAVIAAFEFEHRSGIDIGLSRNDVIPTDDPFLPQIDRFRVEHAELLQREVGATQT